MHNVCEGQQSDDAPLPKLIAHPVDTVDIVLPIILGSTQELGENKDKSLSCLSSLVPANLRLQMESMQKQSTLFLSTLVWLCSDN